MTHLLILLLFVFTALQPLSAEGTDNHVLRAVPVPAVVTIDGDLAEWDASGRIPICSNLALFGVSSAWVMMMYDHEALYVGVDWCDPTPMVNAYDPDLDIDRRKCFHSDSLQLHFRTDRESKLIGWWHSGSKRAAAVALDGWAPWTAPVIYRTPLTAGAEEGFRRKPDGSGYTQELRIPWQLIAARAYVAGESFACMIDLVWGPDSGKGWPDNHMMDLVAPGAQHGGWFWEVERIYGQVALLPAGRLADPVAQPTLAARQPTAAIPVRAVLPDAAATHVSLVISDGAGKRVRTLPGNRSVAGHRVPGSPEQVEDAWDGLDDHGRLVAPGRYRISGLSRGGITATYEQSFYNPGTPPWPTADGTGAWGADHTPPSCVAAAGDGVVIAWAGVEGGSGLIGVDSKGRKRWGDPQGGRVLAADAENAYYILDDSWSGKKGLGRIDHRTGVYRPWMIDGRPDMPVDPARLVGAPAPGEVVGMALHDGRLFLTFASGELAEFEAASLRLIRRLPLPGAGPIAVDRAGRLHVLLAGQPHLVDPVSGAATRIAAEGLADGQAITLDAAGDLLIYDQGPDRQIKTFTPSGRLLRVIGKPGGRALRGPFDPLTLNAVASLAVDARGRIWSVERSELPRRVTVWEPDGRLHHDYVGNTAYAACGTYLHDQDPTLAYDMALEFLRDGASRGWRLHEVMWAPDPARGERLAVSGGLATPQRLRNSASGSAHEYLFTHADWGETGVTLFLRRADGWKPVCFIGLVGHLSGRLEGGTVAVAPAGEFSGLGGLDGVMWNDRNGDGIAQRSECEIMPSAGRASMARTCGWGTRIADDLSIYVNGVVVYRPLGFAADGAPSYGMAGMQRLAVTDSGDLLPLDRERTLVVLSDTGYGGESYMRGLEYGTWRELWRYPSHAHGVHGSHHAAMPSPGEMIGALKIIGSASLRQGGTVVAVRGNLGQDFLMTADGLYVAELFSDCRLPTPSLPQEEQALAGKRVDDRSEGGEPFNGWFGRHDDGVVRICSGMPRTAAMVCRVDGLDTLRRFTGGEIEVDLATLVRAEGVRAAGAAAAAARRRASIHHVTTAPVIDGDLGDWKDATAEAIQHAGSSERAAFRLGWDERHLYLAFEVEDASPWRNQGRDPQRLFKTGDAVDLQFATDPAATGGPGAAHCRLLLAPFAGSAACVLMRPVDPSAPPALAAVYRSPVGERRFDRVEVLASAVVAVRSGSSRYVIEAAVPLAALGWTPVPGSVLRGDAGFISSDSDGLNNVARTYWSNPATNLVNDLPTESWFEPAAWGEFVVR